MFSFSFNIACILFLTMISVFYFSKKKMHNAENRIYTRLIIISFVGLTIDIVGYSFLNINLKVPSQINMLISKMYLLYFLSWIIVFNSYIVAITFKEETKTAIYKKIGYIIFFLYGIFDFIAPLSLVNDGTKIYSSGIAVTIIYLIVVAYILHMLIVVTMYHKRLKFNDKLPLILFIMLGIIAMLIQYFNPEILLITGTECFITVLMYFTIENPDMKMIEELNLAKESADKANRAKTDFLSSMSHEIRTPLNAIVGFSECVETATTLEEAKSNAKDIVMASDTLLEIVNGVLDISKIEAGKIEITTASYNAPELFREMATLIRPKMSDKCLDFQVHIAPDLPPNLFGDHGNMKKVVTNLLSNAYKYTDKGFVRYDVNCVNNHNICRLIISVEDSGRGIKKENVDKLFTKFERLDMDRNTTIEGTGLGLAITKQLVELMGGKIIVQSVYGEGSKFTIVINQRIDNNVVKAEDVNNTTLDLTGKKLLLVDDNNLNLKVGTKLLERYNGIVTTSQSGFNCIERIKAGETYDAILLDDMMPKMSGTETLKNLRSIPNFHIPVIALTANAITGMRERYLRDGFDDYLAKPIEKLELIKVLNKVLKLNNHIVTVAPVKVVEEHIATKEEVALDTGATLKSNIVAVTPEELNESLAFSSKIEEKEDQEANTEVLDTEPQKIIYDKAYLESNGIDMNHAIELLGDMDMYNMTLNDFVSEIDNKINKLNTEKNSGDMKNYAIDVHSLKSDCKYLGFMHVADLAYQHELKSKENDQDFVNKNYDELMIALNKILVVVREYLKHIEIKN
jgi:signal transduction histidine kinase/DNA-binding response OmpR family regulator/HPt (histidine-containing phosphotransfer) domain-containing protein